MEYPFLQPRDFNDTIPEKFDYGYTILDDLEEGWRSAFGEQMMKELKELLIAGNCLETYRIDQLKEKYGMIRLYDHGYHPSEAFWKKIRAWHDKYEALSAFTCCDCGKPATAITQDYICPYCDDCLPSKDKNLPTPADYYSKMPEELKAAVRQLHGEASGL